ncbi:hypothetical protein LQV63_20390 [Paenibacillus profundus]|uniref:Uncharacterized protein n=1 Tax=Paenibacillus profundus TaxID=1173085 RepID=A0ABS8YL48_9BACL|nr:hypothetical protein [Paenibacillus profundus]
MAYHQPQEVRVFLRNEAVQAAMKQQFNDSRLTWNYCGKVMNGIAHLKAKLSTLRVDDDRANAIGLIVIFKMIGDYGFD